jgi:polysaccharide export outer membrane protein
LRRFLVLALPALGIAGCDLLPSDGPNANYVLAGAIEKKKADPAAAVQFALVGIDSRIAAEVDRFYQAPPVRLPPAFRKNPGFGLVGVGDTLHVTIFESGGAASGVFSQAGKGGAPELTVRVDADGMITIPYAGRIQAAGRNIATIEKTIEKGVADQVVEPRVMIFVAESISSIVSVQGEIAKPGFVPLVKPDVRILDVIALSGGSKFPPYETNVRLTRGRSTMDVGLQTIIEQPDAYNVKVDGGDALLLTRTIRKFIALGAVVRAGDQIFLKQSIQLSDALGQVVGLDASRSDAKAVYLFRKEPAELAQRCGIALSPGNRDYVPVVYQLDLKDPKNFFVLTSFPVRPNDILYVSSAPLADVAKFMQILAGATGAVTIPRTLTTNFPASN